MECMQIQGLSDSSSSDSEDDVSVLETTSTSCSTEQSNDEPLINENDLYEKYKEALKLLQANDYDKSENLLKELLNTKLLNIDNDKIDSFKRKSLNQLKYVILKNLSLICADHKKDLQKSLDYLIKCAYIDQSDTLLWYQMGLYAFKLNKFLITKYAYEEAIKLDCNHWPSLDNLIVLSYSMNDFSYCLKYVFEALKIDRMYTNGILILNNLNESNEFYQDSIKDYIKTNYEYNEFETITNRLNSCSSIKKEFDKRVEVIKKKLTIEVNKLKPNNEKISHELIYNLNESQLNWIALGELICHIYTDIQNDSSKRFIDEIIINECSNVIQSEDLKSQEEATNSIEPNNETNLINSQKNSSKNNKKRKIDATGDSEVWTTRRSLRGQEKHDDMSVTDIFTNYFERDYVLKAPSTSNNESSKFNHAFKSLHDSQIKDIRELLKKIKDSSCINIIDLMELYLISLSNSYNLIWETGLKEMFIKVFDILVHHNDFFEEIEKNNHDELDHLKILKTLLCYFELKLSDLKEENFKENQLIEYDNLNLNDKKLILQINELNTNVYQLKTNKSSCEELQYMFIRGLCLQLFININYFTNEKESKFIEELIFNEFKVVTCNYVEVPNSKILQFINNETILTLYMKKEELKIFKTKNMIRNLFTEENYQEVINILEPWIAKYKLPLDDLNLPLRQFSYFLDSCAELKKYDILMANSKNLLRQVIDHYYRNVNTNVELKKIERTFELIEISLDLLLSLAKQDKKYLNEYRHEFIWIFSQIVSFFFENSEFYFKFESFKPLEAIYLLYNLIDKDNHSKINFISEIHEFLAKNSFCSCQNGKFLTWSIENLKQLLKECENCKNNEFISNETDSSMTNTQKITECEICDLCNEQLEQCFYCLFSYKKLRVKYLSNHSTNRVEFSLENSFNLYNFFKPSKLPEYDSVKQLSISSEFNDFLLIIVKLLEKNDEYKTECEISFENFQMLVQDDDFESFKENVQSIKINIESPYQKEIFYLIGDYYNRIPDFTNATNYYIRDLIHNLDRFDSWAGLALARSELVLQDYVTKYTRIKTLDEATSLMEKVNFAINCYRKALDLIEFDYKLSLEYGSFLYQLNSYFSRQIKMNEVFNFFVEKDKLVNLFEEKSRKFLDLALEAYQYADKCDLKSTALNTNIESTQDSIIPSIVSLTSESTSRDSSSDDEDKKEDWLHYYMFGKITEKQNGNLNEIISFYIKSLDYLHASGIKYSKKFDIKSKSSSVSLQLASFEVVYRIYAIVLKSIKKTLIIDYDKLLSNLKVLSNKQFVQAYEDFHYDRVQNFLLKIIDSESVPQELKVVYKECVCLCITGLHQILTRFPLHYRALYRLACFYTDLKKYKLARNILLGYQDWSSFPYMPCQGLFFERKNNAFFNGVWLSQVEEIERLGSYSWHLFLATRLLIESMEKTRDSTNLVSVTRLLFANKDNYVEDFMNEHLAFSSLRALLRVLRSIITHDYKGAQPIVVLLDAYEARKLCMKHLTIENENINAILIQVYFFLHPEHQPSVLEHNMSKNRLLENISKYCVALEKQNKATTVKPQKNRTGQKPKENSQNSSIINSKIDETKSSTAMIEIENIQTQPKTPEEIDLTIEDLMNS